MSEQNQRPIERKRNPWVAAPAVISLMLFAVAGVILILPMLIHACDGRGCLFYGLFLLVVEVFVAGLAAYLGALAALTAIVHAFDKRDLPSALSLILSLVLALLAAYALFRNGAADDPLLTAIYGFPPHDFYRHPFAYYATFAFIPAVPATALAHSLTRGERAQRLAPLTGGGLALAPLLAIRVTSFFG